MLTFWSRRKLHRQPIPAAQRELLEHNVRHYRLLPESLRAILEKQVQILLGEKKFEGCGGLIVTEEMRVTVAGYAGLLLLHKSFDYYPRLGTVVLYPESFATPIRSADHAGIVTETVEERLGESWQEGTVVLAWESIREFIDGRGGDCNVILHEFAHQIDVQCGFTAGAPLLTQPDGGHDWEELLESEQRWQRAARRRGRPAILDPYAFTSAEELFAVATETFYMRPLRLKANHADLYRELQAVYGMDPASWAGG